MPAYNKRPYAKSTRVTIRGVVKRPYRPSGGYGGGAPMQIVTSGLAPLRTGGFFGPRRNMQEKKTIDIDPADYTANTTGTVTLLNGVATGTDFTERVGRKIFMKSLFIRGFVSSIDATTSNTIARLLVVYDKQTNAAAPTITDILKSVDASAQLNLNNRDRFSVLIDKQYALAATDTTATQAFAGSPTVHNVKLFRKLRHEEVFGGTTAAFGSITTGALWMVTLSTVAGNFGGNFHISTRIRFADA